MGVCLPIARHFTGYGEDALHGTRLHLLCVFLQGLSDSNADFILRALVYHEVCGVGWGGEWCAYPCVREQGGAGVIFTLLTKGEGESKLATASQEGQLVIGQW